MPTPYRSLLFFLLLPCLSFGQSFLLGADLSYVNEMEDCGAAYQEEGVPKDPYAIFAGHGCGLVRLRLWHTPAWYDQLNEGRRYGDLTDVSRSIRRARNAGMKVLLDFHLSDNWADPGKQIVPQAWNAVVDNLPALKDSLYNYVYQTLSGLHTKGLLPEMVQIGNETNRGILLSQAVNDAGWTLDWNRNSQLFNSAIRAVRTVQAEAGQKIQIVLHGADPKNADWLFGEFIARGVTDFDIMGISYYWPWHQPAGIDQTAQFIAGLRGKHPGYEVIIVETGYIWTTQARDQANNILNETHPGYRPASPDAQRRWLIDLTKAVLAAGGRGVIYWEPAWVSTNCRTQWAQGSHYENAAFFDFEHNLIPTGGIAWLSYDYGTTTATTSPIRSSADIRIFTDGDHRRLTVVWPDGAKSAAAEVHLTDSAGRTILSRKITPGDLPGHYEIMLPALPAGLYLVVVRRQGAAATGKIVIVQ